MKTSQEFLSQQNIVPLLSLAKRTQDNKTIDTGPHTVRMIEDAKGFKTNPRTGKKEECMWFLMEENGQKVKYPVPLMDESGQVHYLLQRLGTVPEGTEIILEYKKREGSFKGYIDVQIVGQEVSQKAPEEISDEEIPIIETNEGDTEISEPY
jgi:hypothetical protein